MLTGTSELQAIGETNIYTPKLDITLTNQFIVGSTKQVSFLSTTGFVLRNFLDGIYFTDRFVIFGTATGGDSLGSTGTIHTHGATWQGSSWGINLGATITMGKFVVTGNTLSAFYLENCTSIKRIASMDGITWAGTTTISTNTANTLIGMAPISNTELYTMGGSVGSSIGIYQIYYINLSNGISRSINSGQYISFSPERANSDMNALRKDNYDIIFTSVGVSKDVGIMYHLSDTLNTFKQDYLIKLGQFPDRIMMGNLSLGISYDYMSFKVSQSKTVFNSGQTIVSGISLTSFIIKFPKNNDYDAMFNYTFLNRGLTASVNLNPVVIAGSTNQTGSTAFEYYYITDNQFPVQIVNRQESMNISQNIVQYVNANNNRINLTLGNYR